ncbi:MAG: hypothetical protein K8I04_09770 [Gammaproteobacteria bacterium]|nr:hypothetical protein [Gammaproteobacteria bacterium]
MPGMMGPAWESEAGLPLSTGCFFLADLQAKATAEYLLLALVGKPPITRFKVELIFIVNVLDHGILAYRNEKRAIVLPPCRLSHWARCFSNGGI